MNKLLFTFMLLVFARPITFSQSVGIGTTTPDASSVLELKATNKGFLPPRMTASEKGLIPAPKAGLIIYQTDGVTGLYVYNGSAWVSVAGSASVVGGWSLTGNPGINPATAFIGTTDNQPLKFRVNNITSGGIHPTNGNVGFGMYALDSAIGATGNSGFGYNALHANKTGFDNSAFGIAALFNNISGKLNVAIGSGAMVANTVGSNNTVAGVNSLYNNTSGSMNNAFGYEALNYNKTGNFNIGIGMGASKNNETGNNIIAIGDSALFKNTMSYNMAVGSRALRYNTTGVSNTALGADVLYNNVTGNQNTGVGRTSLYNNISGIQNTAVGVGTLRYNAGGDGNTAVGFQSLLFNVDNNNNTALGHIALASTTADNNTGIGKSALTNNTFGTFNTAVGVDALATNTIGNYNTGVGYKAEVYGNNYTNATAVGALSQAGCSDCVILGSVNGYNGASVTAKTGIGIVTPEKTLHVNPNGAGGIAIGNRLTTGGYTSMNMGISQASGGYSFIQSTMASWPTPTYGDLILNPSGGNVAIGKTTASTPLHIKQSTDNNPLNGGLRLERHDNGNFWDISVSYADVLHLVYKGVDKVRFSNIDGDIWQSSDLRLKRDIQNFETALPKLMKLEAKSYHYKDNEADAPLSYGFIAQEVEKIFPGAVSTNSKDGMKAIAYQKLNMLAIKSIQEQQVIIEGQQKEIDLLKQQNIDTQNALQQLQKAIEEIKAVK